MKYTAKLINVGLSTYILVPANIRHLLEIKSGDILEVDIVKINNKEVEEGEEKWKIKNLDIL